jgi:Ricin-type beta-trefoil lectin domain-like
MLTWHLSRIASITRPATAGPFVVSRPRRFNGRFLDAHESAANDFAAVTRTAQNNNSQLWVVVQQGDGSYTLQQLNNGARRSAYLPVPACGATEVLEVSRHQAGLSA